MFGNGCATPGEVPFQSIAALAALADIDQQAVDTPLRYAVAAGRWTVPAASFHPATGAGGPRRRRPPVPEIGSRSGEPHHGAPLSGVLVSAAGESRSSNTAPSGGRSGALPPAVSGNLLVQTRKERLRRSFIRVCFLGPVAGKGSEGRGHRRATSPAATLPEAAATASPGDHREARGDGALPQKAQAAVVDHQAWRRLSSSMPPAG